MVEQQIMKKRKWTWIVAVVVLILLIAASACVGRWYFYFKAHPEEAAKLLGYATSEDMEALKAILLNKQSPQWGAEKPIITIVEFGDFRCPQCYKEFFVLRPLLIKYQDKIRFYWRDYPVVAEESLTFALAGRCSQEQGKFLQFHDKLFQKQSELKTTDLVKISQQVGLNSFLFTQCLEKKLKLGLINNDIKDAETLGVKGTPTLFINNQKISGAGPADVLEKIILDILNKYEISQTKNK
ncbi:thioredoxin domain-containing protein [Candidatus Falkowbacteria bacterium]|nr:thioredoxin domain-containing protein [Candidatus Falkowbacteria bacterium]